MHREHLLQIQRRKGNECQCFFYLLTGSANKRFGQLVEGTSGKPLSAIYARSMDSLITKSLRASIRSHHSKMAQTGRRVEVGVDGAKWNER